MPRKKTNKEMHMFSLRLPLETIQAMEVECKKTGMRITELARKVLVDKYGRKTRKPAALDSAFD